MTTTDARRATSRRDETSPIRPRLLLVLALLAAVAPLATDLYLSAFPAMASELSTSATSIQLTLTAFLLGLAVGQLVFGPLSDRLGRRRPLLIGAALLVVASAAAVFAPTVEVLVGARLVQGLAGAAGMVIGRAVIADLASGTVAARALSLMMVVGGVAPVIAPLFGSVLVDSVGWRGVLAVLLALAVIMLVAVLTAVPETLPESRRGSSAGGGWKALWSRQYVTMTLTFVLGFATMMAYISASPFVYQELIGMEPITYGLLFGLNALGLMITSALTTRLLGRFSARALLGTGVAVVVVACFALLVLVLVEVPVVWVTVPLFFVVSALGLVFGTAAALALGAATGAAGKASAVLGAVQFALAAAVSPLVSIGGEGSVRPLALVMISTAVLAGVAYLAGGRTPAERSSVSK